MKLKKLFLNLVLVFVLNITATLSIAQNLIANDGFENGTSNWSTWGGYGTLSSATSPVHSGSKSLKIIGGVSGVQAYQYVTLEAGKVYQISGWINMPAPSVTTAFLGIYGNGCGDYLYPRTFITGQTPGWVKFGPYIFTAPGCVGSQYVQLGGYGNGATVYWDDISLTELTGGIPDSNGVTTDWYEEFVAYSISTGDYYSSDTDGGVLAWGEAYLQWGFINLYNVFKDTSWLNYMVMHTDQMIATMSDTPLFSPYDPQYIDGYAGWGQNRYSQYTPNYTEWFCDYGNISGPILRFVEIVYNDPNLHAAYLTKADQYLSAIENEVMLLWYNNWDPDPGWTEGDNSRYQSNAGYHVYEWSGWINQPFNMHLGFAEAMMTLRRISASPLYTPADPVLSAWYVAKSDLMLQNFKDELTYRPSNQLYEWKYGPNSYWPTLEEDVGHAWLDLNAAVQGANNGIAFNSTDMQRFANTFIHNVWNGSLTNPEFHYYTVGTPHATYDSPNGSTPRGHWGWGFLYFSGYDYQIWEAMASYFDKYIDVSAGSPHIATTAAMLAYTSKLYDTYSPGMPGSYAVTQSGSDVNISWQIPALDNDGTELTGVAGYNVYRSGNGQNGSYVLINPTPVKDSEYIDSDNWGLGYWYKVITVDYADNLSPFTAPILAGTFDADFDNSGLVDYLDAEFLLSQWLSNSPQNHPSTGKSPDLKTDGKINLGDLAFFAFDWSF